MTLDERLRQVFADVFDIDPDDMGDDDSPHTIEKWDSVSHLSLVLALEGEFMIQFAAEVIPDLASFRTIRNRLVEERATDG